MNKYIWIALAVSLLVNIGGYAYFNARIEAKDATIALEQTKVKDAVEDVFKLDLEVQKLNARLRVRDVEYQKILEDYEAYKSTVANIKPRTITSVKTIIQEVPAELVVEQANETSNETLRRINASADEFKRVRN